MIWTTARGSLWLLCEICNQSYQPKPRVVDMTASAEQRTQLHFELRRRASRQGWRSIRAASEPWRDYCLEHRPLSPDDNGRE